MWSLMSSYCVIFNVSLSSYERMAKDTAWPPYTCDNTIIQMVMPEILLIAWYTSVSSCITFKNCIILNLYKDNKTISDLLLSGWLKLNFVWWIGDIHVWWMTYIYLLWMTKYFCLMNDTNLFMFGRWQDFCLINDKF